MLNAAALLILASATAYDPIFHDAFESPATCPNSADSFRLTTSDIGYMGDNIPDGIRYRVGMTEYDNIWGHADPYDSIVTWPGRSNSAPIILDFNKQSYLSAHFTVPQDVQINMYGWLTHTEYSYGQDLTASISTSCGDFSPSSAACYIETTSGQVLTRWKTGASTAMCQLQPGQDYFYNIKMTDPNRPSTTCSNTAEVCAIGTANAFGQ